MEFCKGTILIFWSLNQTLWRAALCEMKHERSLETLFHEDLPSLLQNHFR